MSESITFKLPEELRAALEKEAQNDGRSLSDYIRRHFITKLNVAPTNRKLKPGRAAK